MLKCIIKLYNKLKKKISVRNIVNYAIHQMGLVGHATYNMF